MGVLNGLFLAYFWTRLDVINTFAWLSLGLLVLILLFTLLILDTVSELEVLKIKFLRNKTIHIIASIAIAAILFLPNKRDFLYIYLIPKTVESQFVLDTIELINSLPDFIKEKLDQ